jgi:CMP-N-acetylneuraminic acid synthetase
MIRGRRVLALVPARAGSKGVPGKNLRPLAGQPLIAWTIGAAKAASSIDRIVVSTDSDDVAALVLELGAEVPFRRPEDLASDEATGPAVVRHALIALADPADLVVYLQPTSPLRTSEDIEACLDLATIDADRSVASVRPLTDPPEWMFRIDGDGRLARLLDDPIPLRRQDADPAYVLNGAVYVAPIQAFLRTARLVNEATAGYVMPADRSIDIDTLDDFEAAEAALARQATAGAHG